MLPRTVRPLTLGAAASALPPPPVPLSRVLRSDRGVRTEPETLVAVPEVVPAIIGAAIEPERADEGCELRPGDIVCADDASCIGPLSGHVTDAERAVMNDIFRQASRLTTVLTWLFALVALTSLVLLMLR